MVNRTHAEIFDRWLRYITTNEARAEADAFVARLKIQQDNRDPGEAELDAVLALVAGALATPAR
jgi:hypothetical protein